MYIMDDNLHLRIKLNTYLRKTRIKMGPHDGEFG